MKQSEDKDDATGPVFAFQMLRPIKGHFLRWVFSSSIALFIVIILFLWTDYGQLPDILQAARIFGYCLAMSFILWSIAYIISPLGKQKETSAHPDDK